MRALRVGATILAMTAGLQVGAARADGVIARPKDPYIYVTQSEAASLVYNWTGIYAGGHLGAANSKIEWTYDLTSDDPKHSHTGFTGGGFAGVQKQWTWLVLGAEVGYLWMDQPESTGSSNVLFPTTRLSSNVHNVLLVTGKLGWAWDNVLGYFKAGYATGDVEFRTTVSGSGALLTSSSGRENGWTAGAGLEYALLDHVILGVEYDYVQLNAANRTQVPSAIGPPLSHVVGGVDIQSVTARLSFKFGGGRAEVIPAQ